MGVMNTTWKWFAIVSAACGAMGVLAWVCLPRAAMVAPIESPAFAREVSPEPTIDVGRRIDSREQAAPVTRTTPATASLPEKTTPAAQAIVQAEIAARVRVLDQHYATEPRDSAWAPGAEALLAEVAHTDVLPHTDVVRTQCRQTVCVAEYATASREEFTRIHEFADIGGDSGYFLEVPTPRADGTRHLVVYLARAGHALPSLR